MKCWRVLYTPDNTAFMIWAKTEEMAFEKARKRNRSELGQENDSKSEYWIDEFTPDTNGTGMMAFYDVYTIFERRDENGKLIKCEI